MGLHVDQRKKNCLYNFIKESLGCFYEITRATLRLENVTIFPDILIEDHNVIIEFYGDYWHANPRRYQSDDFIHKVGCYAKDIWEHDKRRKKFLESWGYKVLIFWENDYSNERKHKRLLSRIIDNCAS